LKITFNFSEENLSKSSIIIINFLSKSLSDEFIFSLIFSKLSVFEKLKFVPKILFQLSCKNFIKLFKSQSNFGKKYFELNLFEIQFKNFSNKLFSDSKYQGLNSKISYSFFWSLKFSLNKFKKLVFQCPQGAINQKI
jgi:hypothetical protein